MRSRKAAGGDVVLVANRMGWSRRGLLRGETESKVGRRKRESGGAGGARAKHTKKKLWV